MVNRSLGRPPPASARGQPRAAPGALIIQVASLVEFENSPGLLHHGVKTCENMAVYSIML